LSQVSSEGVAEQQLGPLDRHVAAVKSGRWKVLVGTFLLLVDHDQPEVRTGSEDGRTRADHDPRTTGADQLPGAGPLRIGQAGVQAEQIGQPAGQAV